MPPGYHIPGEEAGDIRTRVLLAPMPDMQPGIAEDQHGLLEAEVREER